MNIEPAAELPANGGRPDHVWRTPAATALLDAGEVTSTQFVCNGVRARRVSGPERAQRPDQRRGRAGQAPPQRAARRSAWAWMAMATACSMLTIISSAYVQWRRGHGGRDGPDGCDWRHRSPRADGCDGCDRCDWCHRLQLEPQVPPPHHLDERGHRAGGLFPPTAGQKIQAGVDSNRNGVLDAVEITSTTLCVQRRDRCHGVRQVPPVPRPQGPAGLASPGPATPRAACRPSPMWATAARRQHRGATAPQAAVGDPCAWWAQARATLDHPAAGRPDHRCRICCCARGAGDGNK